MNKTADIVVVGGGIVGTSVALCLARLGQQVLLLERKELAAGASGACLGNVEPYPLLDGLEDISKLGYDMLIDLSQELDMDYEYRKVSSLFLIFDEPEWEAMDKRVREDRDKGAEVYLISSKEVQELEPSLKGVYGAVYTPLAGRLNPMKFTLALGNAATKNQVNIKTQCEVTGIRVNGDRITHLETTDGIISPGLVINATGAWAGPFGQGLGLNIPVIPCRGQLMISESVPHLINGLVTEARRSLWQPETDFDPIIGLKTSPAGFPKQTKNGNLVLGGIHEYCGFDCRNTWKVISETARSITRAQRFLKYPITQVQVIRMWAGLRPVTPDHKPIIGWDNTFDNLFHAVGHFHYGILLGPITGKLIAQWIVHDEVSELLKPLTPARFNMLN